MNRTESRPFRERLLASRTILRGDIEGLFERARRSREEGGANAPSDEHILRLLAEKERILELVERALERIEDRTYGTCHQCGAPIELKRLKTLPFESHCLACVNKLALAARPSPVDIWPGEAKSSRYFWPLADDELAQRVWNALYNLGVPELERMEIIEQNEGVITLRGRVASAHSKWQSLSCARHIPGVLRVIDELDIEGADESRSAGQSSTLTSDHYLD